jgi:DNA-binding MarR family transcriptional regulator
MFSPSNPGQMSKNASASADQAGTTDTDFDFTELVGHLLRRAYQRHVAIFQQTIKEYQLTAAQFAVLCTVRDQGSCSLSEIVKVTAIDQATVRGIIERLKLRKLITVIHNPDDRRKVSVSMTDEGVTMIRQTIPLVQQISELTFNGLNPAERVAMLYLLRKMAEFDDVGLDEPV